MVWRHAYNAASIHVESASSLSLLFSLSLFLSYYYSSFFIIFTHIFSLFFLFFHYFHFFILFFFLFSKVELASSWYGMNLLRVLTDLPYTWTFVSYDTKSQVCDVGISKFIPPTGGTKCAVGAVLMSSCIACLSS